jgi:hypothetical protein
VRRDGTTFRSLDDSANAKLKEGRPRKSRFSKCQLQIVCRSADPVPQLSQRRAGDVPSHHLRLVIRSRPEAFAP